MPAQTEGPRIYNLFPPLLGPIRKWREHLPRIRDMGFNWLFLNPFHEPGGSGSLYSVKDYYRLHPLLRGASEEPADTLLGDFVEAAREAGLAVIMDLVINHTAKDSPLVSDHPEWYLHDEHGEVLSPRAVDLDDPDQVQVWGDLAELDYSERPERGALLETWRALIRHYLELGFQGFRCDAAYQLPGEVWQSLISDARELRPEARFFAETLGAGLDQVEQLGPAGFDYFFNSGKWWDFRESWLLEQYAALRRLAPSIGFPESHDTARLAAESDGDARESRFRYLFSALFSSGVMMPIGYEFGFRRPLHVVETRPEDWEEPAFDISDYIAEVNRLKAATPVFNQEGPQERFTDPEAGLVGLLRQAPQGSQRAAILINPDPQDSQSLARAELADSLNCRPSDMQEITPRQEDDSSADAEPLSIAARSIRVFLVA
jgi:starch synthase (maltosyl-transferring)